MLYRDYLDGKVIEVDLPEGMGDKIASAIAASNGFVYFITTDGIIYSLKDLTFTEVYSILTDVNYVRFFESPTGIVYVSTIDFIATLEDTSLLKITDVAANTLLDSGWVQLPTQLLYIGQDNIITVYPTPIQNYPATTAYNYVFSDNTLLVSMQSDSYLNIWTGNALQPCTYPSSMVSAPDKFYESANGTKFVTSESLPLFMGITGPYELEFTQASDDTGLMVMASQDTLAYFISPTQGKVVIYDSATNTFLPTDIEPQTALPSYENMISMLRDGSIIFSNADNHTLTRINPDGSVSVSAEVEGMTEPGIMAILLPTGDVLVAHQNGAVIKYDSIMLTPIVLHSPGGPILSHYETKQINDSEYQVDMWGDAQTGVYRYYLDTLPFPCVHTPSRRYPEGVYHIKPDYSGRAFTPGINLSGSGAATSSPTAIEPVISKLYTGNKVVMLPYLYDRVFIGNHSVAISNSDSLIYT